MTSFKLTFEVTIQKYYIGYVSCYEGNRKIWTESTGINRLTKEDAQEDAIQLKTELINQNRGGGL